MAMAYCVKKYMPPDRHYRVVDFGSRLSRGQTLTHRDLLGDQGDLLRRLPFAEDHLGHALPERASGDGVVVLGDSGGLVEVASLKGIHYAMTSGILAARAIHEASMTFSLTPTVPHTSWWSRDSITTRTRAAVPSFAFTTRTL